MPFRERKPTGARCVSGGGAYLDPASTSPVNGLAKPNAEGLAFSVCVRSIMVSSLALGKRKGHRIPCRHPSGCFINELVYSV